MPIYEYTCNQCKENWDVLQKVGDAPPLCPKCNSADVKKEFTATHKLYFGPNRMIKDRMK
jgi:putative FmdB family regulatory protein